MAATGKTDFSDHTITQDDPRLIEHIRKSVIFPPSKLPYNLSKAHVFDHSEFNSTSTFIWPLIKDLEVRHTARYVLY